MVGVLNGKKGKAVSFVVVAFLLCGVFGGLVVKQSVAGTPAGTITYSAGSDTITVVGANSSHPCEFLDLYNADVAGGWGQVSKSGDSQFVFSCGIAIGNSTGTATFFNDSLKSVYFVSSVTYDVYVYSGGVLTLGVVTNSGLKTTKNGCFVKSASQTVNTLWVTVGGICIMAVLLMMLLKFGAKRLYNFAGEVRRVYNMVKVNGVWQVVAETSLVSNTRAKVSVYAIIMLVVGIYIAANVLPSAINTWLGNGTVIGSGGTANATLNPLWVTVGSIVILAIVLTTILRFGRGK